MWQVTGEEESGDSPIEILTDSVGRQTLRDELTLNGELRRDELSTINSPFDGRVSQVGIADGDEIAAGDVILSLDGRPAVAANGDFSFYRPSTSVLTVPTCCSSNAFCPRPVTTPAT